MRKLLVATLLLCGCPDNGGDNTVDANQPDLSDVGSRMDASIDVSVSNDSGMDATIEPTCEVRFLEAGEEPFQTLDEYCLFDGIEPNAGVHRFEVASVLFADDSRKDRYLAIPDGSTIGFSDDDRWTYPDRSILVKTFYYPLDEREPDGARRMLETRLIVKRGDEWEPYIYVWNEEQTEARYERLGLWIPVDRIVEDGTSITSNYRVPNSNQCGSCHAQNDALLPLGPRTRQLNIDVDGSSQLERFAELGLFSSAIPPVATLPSLEPPMGNGDLERRARSYFEANCAHCHNPDGAGGTSGLNLGVNVETPVQYGVCKSPVAAGAGAGGRFFDIQPGDADRSIIIFRMQSLDPEIKMPELPTQTSDDRGVQLISEWIDAMTPIDCNNQ